MLRLIPINQDQWHIQTVWTSYINIEPDSVLTIFTDWDADRLGHVFRAPSRGKFTASTERLSTLYDFQRRKKREAFLENEKATNEMFQNNPYVYHESDLKGFFVEIM